MHAYIEIKDNPLLSVLVLLLLVVFGTFVGVLFCDGFQKYVSTRLDISEKSDVLKFIGIAMGGILIALQALMSYKRAKALENTANSQADVASAQADAANAQAKATEEQARANRLAEEGQRQERMKNAIEHLGNNSDSVRLGGAYELYHLAEDTGALRQTVLDVLCAHIRQTTGEDEYREKHKSKPAEEVQSLLTLLFVRNHRIFRGCHINLQESWLNGADIREAHLERADLAKAYLQGTILFEAHLQKANFREARLQGANLGMAHLQAADFIKARMQGAQLFRARLQGAELFGAQMQGARLYLACLQGARFTGVHLQGADLFQAQLQGVCGGRAPHKFADRMRNQIGNKTELHDVIFAGDLSREQLDSFAENLSDEQANKLREKLQPHIGQQEIKEPPTGHREAVTGAYTRKEAEKWIAEYEEAMSGIAEDDS